MVGAGCATADEEEGAIATVGVWVGLEMVGCMVWEDAEGLVRDEGVEVEFLKEEGMCAWMAGIRGD